VTDRQTASVIALLMVTALTTGALAVSREWDGGGDGTDWFDPNNWNPNGGPDRHDNLVVCSGGPLAHADVYSSNGGSVTIDGPAASVSLVHSFQDKNDLYVGYSGCGTLDIRNGGGMHSDNSFLGWNSDSEGTATVEGAGSTWRNYRLRVGYLGRGTLNISSGGSVLSRSGFIGDLHDSQGTATVDGADSVWACTGDLRVGCSGKGALEIRNGANVSCRWDAFIGCGTGSEGLVTIDGAGSTLTVTSISVSGVGGLGRGTLDIQNGGSVVSSAWFYIGSNDGSEGTVTVRGANSTWTHEGSLYIGGSHWFPGGRSCVNATNGGAVTVGEAIQIWHTGELNMSGGTVTIGSGPAETEANTLVVHSNGELRGDGRILGNVASDGFVRPTGLLNIEGDYHQHAGGTVAFTLPGADGAGPVTLGVTRSARLGGTLAVELRDGFTPELGDSFDIIVAAQIEGAFDAVSGLDFGNGLRFTIDYADAAVTLEVVPEPATLALLALGALTVIRRRRR